MFVPSCGWPTSPRAGMNAIAWRPTFGKNHFLQVRPEVKCPSSETNLRFTFASVSSACCLYTTDAQPGNCHGYETAMGPVLYIQEYNCVFSGRVHTSLCVWETHQSELRGKQTTNLSFAAKPHRLMQLPHLRSGQWE